MHDDVTASPPAHPSNAEQARGWDGPGGAFWAENADRFDAEVADYQAAFLDAAALRPTDRVLDVGCGTGQTTRDVARRVTEGSALGVDLSAEMLAVARARADRDGMGNVTFAQADVQIHPFGAGAVDRVVSRNGAMFFGDPPMAFANLAHTLVSGGLLVLLVWQPLARNHWMQDFLTAVAGTRPPEPPTDAPGPFSLSDPDRVRDLLVGAGFDPPRCTDLRGFFHAGADVAEAERFVTGLTRVMLAELDDVARGRAMARLRETLEEHATPDGVRYDSAMWLVTARRP